MAYHLVSTHSGVTAAVWLALDRFDSRGHAARLPAGGSSPKTDRTRTTECDRASFTSLNRAGDIAVSAAASRWRTVRLIVAWPDKRFRFDTISAVSALKRTYVVVKRLTVTTAYI